MSTAVFERDQYVPDGGMRWSRLPILLLLPLVVAAMTAFLLHLLFHSGWYLVILIAFAAGGLVSGAMFLAVRWSQCRRPWLAASIGLLSGVIVYLGFFYFGMVSMLGPGMAKRVDFLPQFIQFRMATDVQADAARPVKPGDKPREASLFMNWSAFVFESLIILGFGFETGRRTALRAFDTRQDCWTKRETVRLPPGSKANLGSSLTANRIADFCENHKPAAIANGAAACTLTLEYTATNEVSPLERPVYLSADETPLRTGVRSLFGRSSLFLQRELSANEALKIQPFFPEFAELLQTRHEELRSAPPVVAGLSAKHSAATSTATITSVADHDRVHIFSGKHLLLENLCGLAPMVGIALGVGWSYLAWLMHEHLGVAAAIGIGVFGAIPILASIYVALSCPHAAETFYSRAVLRRKFVGRTGCLVEPNDPDCFHVVLTRRENWQKVKLETASDAGFAILGANKRELQMECDAERFRIPFDSIVACDPEMFMSPIDQNSQFWAVRLVVQIPDGQRELLFCDATPSWSRQTNASRKKKAEDLSQQLAG